MSISFHHQELENGLNVLVESSPRSHSFAAGLFVRAGSRDEPTPLNGVSHFLEHMLFKGSDKLDWQAINRGFDELGARYNAYTTQEMTAYYAGVLPEFSTGILELLEQLFEPALRAVDFDTEKKVILEEIAMYDDEPGQRVYEKLMEAHFANHPLGPSVIGTRESITRMTREEMASYFTSRYGPRNTVLAIAGKVDEKRLLDDVSRIFGHWKGPSVSREISMPRPTGTKLSLVDAKLNRAYVMGMTAGPDAQDDDRFAARVLADVIGDSEGSRLYWALVDPALAEDADFGFYPHDGCGSFYLSLVCDVEKAERVLEIALKELARVRVDLNDDEVERARNKIASSVTLGGESPMGRMRVIGSEWVYNRSYRSVEDDLRTLEGLTTARLRSLLEKYTFEPMTLASLAPREVVL